MNWHLLAIAISFYGTMFYLADFIHSLRWLDIKNHGGWLAFWSTVLFLTITWTSW